MPQVEVEFVDENPTLKQIARKPGTVFFFPSDLLRPMLVLSGFVGPEHSRVLELDSGRVSDAHRGLKIRLLGEKTVVRLRNVLDEY